MPQPRRKHYLQVTEEHFERAPKGAQNRTQQTAELLGTGGQQQPGTPTIAEECTSMPIRALDQLPERTPLRNNARFFGWL